MVTQKRDVQVIFAFLVPPINSNNHSLLSANIKQTSYVRGFLTQHASRRVKKVYTFPNVVSSFGTLYSSPPLPFLLSHPKYLFIINEL